MSLSLSHSHNLSATPHLSEDVIYGWSLERLVRQPLVQHRRLHHRGEQVELLSPAVRGLQCGEEILIWIERERQKKIKPDPNLNSLFGGLQAAALQGLDGGFPGRRNRNHKMVAQPSVFNIGQRGRGRVRFDKFRIKMGRELGEPTELHSLKFKATYSTSRPFASIARGRDR